MVLRDRVRSRRGNDTKHEAGSDAKKAADLSALVREIAECHFRAPQVTPMGVTWGGSSSHLRVKSANNFL
jgi:hypothetical protein